MLMIQINVSGRKKHDIIGNGKTWKAGYGEKIVRDGRGTQGNYVFYFFGEGENSSKLNI